MNLSPVANRSFLHGDRKPSPNSEKVVYATLDSLALKRARLPLQLLPVGDGNNTAEKVSESKKKRNGSDETATERSSFKVDSAKQHAKYLLVIPSVNSEGKRSEIVEEESHCIVKEVGRKIDTDDNDNSIEVVENESTDSSNASDRENAISLDSVCKNEGYSVDENEASLSDDYERIEVTFPIVQAKIVEVNDTVEDQGTLYSNGVPLRSKFVSDLTRKCLSDTGLNGETYLVKTLVEEKTLTGESLLGGEDGKKKKHFARHVLHLVPGYLVKGPRKMKKKKGKMSSSLSSLNPISVDLKIETNLDSGCRSRSLSREELRYLKISSPTNFVHVASATNPSLVLNENAVGFSLEQVVITHEEKCATLPLLIARDENSAIDGYGEERPIVIEKTMAPFVASIRGISNQQTPRKDEAFDRESLRRELLLELQERSAKILEQSQQVKTSETRVDTRQGKTHVDELGSTLSSRRANSSFLWSSQAKNLLENPRRKIERFVANEAVEDPVDDEEYDDVGPLDSINQEDVYDDVGLPTTANGGNSVAEPASRDSDSIYDDVETPSDPENGRANRACIAEEPVAKDVAANSSAEARGDESDEEDGHYLLVVNEYSSVDEEEMDEMQDDEQGVYDDVGLPSEERVNSLYAGSTTGSIFGKESEWEDLDDSTIGFPLPSTARKNNLSKSTETQVLSIKKKAGQRWSRKVKRQRSRASRKSWKSLNKPGHDSATISVAVSLGRGSVLLVGCTEKSEECSKEETNGGAPQQDSQRTQGLVQMRVIDLDEDVDTQETSCYIHEDNTSDDSTYESLHSFQQDDFSSDSETETIDAQDQRVDTIERISSTQVVHAYLEAPTRPNPPPPREGSLTQTLGRRIKMLRRTWSITKGSLGRMRRKTSVEDDRTYDENKESPNDHPNLDGGKYFSFARHFKKSVTGHSTFYLNGYSANGSNDSTRTSNEPIYSNTSRELDHYSVLADQEPLYQFYAAAAVRVACDSNSDGYEEVEDTIPSRSTTELTKPGYRTLWCQTPQVLSSGLLQRLSVEERKVQEAKFEILTSEASYLNSLRVLDNEFLNEFSVNEILTPSERDKLFSGIPSVLHASEQFLAELEAIWRHDPMLHGLPEVILKYADKCSDIYVAYCSNQVSIDTTLKDLRSRKGLKFLETVSQIEARPTCQSLSLHSFLMLPMQRITRLPLLADAVLSKLPIEHVDRSQWERVLSSLSNVVAECNEGARAAAKEVEMESLARKLEYSAKIKPIVLKGKHLIKSGSVVQLLTKADTEYKLTFGKKFNKTPLYLLLLTDYLLVAKYKSNAHDETYTVIDTCKRSLIALESVPEDSPFGGRNAMLLTLLENYAGHQVEYILTCESNTERQRWLEAVSPSKRGLVGETLYEVWDCPQVVVLYSYSPNQPDELSLHPGDVINVLTKMSDGWFHGEKLLDGEQGWFPGNYTKEVASEHVRARNLKQRHRLLALNGSALQRKVKPQSAIC